MAIVRDMNHYYNCLSDLVNKKQKWDAFNVVLDKYTELHQKKLLQSNDPVDIYRAQGAIEALNKLRYLRQEVNGTE